MIEIQAVLDKDGVLRSCKVNGHAKAGKTGTDIVCAAVSVLMEAAVNTISNGKGIVVKYGAPEEGQLWFEAGYEAEGKEFLFAAGQFLLNGLSSVTQKYPQNCKLIVKT